MQTFEAQVEGLTSLTISSSSAPTQTELSDFLSDGAAEIINAMPMRLKYLCATEDTFNSAAVGSEPKPLTSGQVLSVSRTDGSVYYPCREIPAATAGRVSDSSAFASSHMEKATDTDPVYYIYNGRLNSLPATLLAGGTAANKYLEVNRPSVAYTHSSMATSLASFPLEYEYLVVTYAAIKSLQNAMGNKTSDLPADISFPSIPVAPSAPSFDTGAFSISTSPPTYTSPVFSAPTLASINDLTLPVIPTVPTLSAQSVTITGTAPVYVGPSYSKIDTYIETDEDVELAQAKLQEVSSQIQDSLNRFNDSNVEYQAILQKNVQDAQLSDSNEARKLQKYSNEVQTYSAEVNAKVQEWVNEEWTQKFQKYQQDYSSKLQEYNTNLQNALNNFNKENTSYQNELQEKIQEANNQQTKDSAEYSAKIQKYSNEMQGYSAEVNKSVQDFNTKLQKHSTDYQWLQSQYAQLKSDYNSGLQLLLGRPLAAGEQQGR
jgi:hypothetical protein